MKEQKEIRTITEVTRATEGAGQLMDDALTALHINVPEIRGMGLVSAEGLPIYVSMPQEWDSGGMDEDQACAMVSGLVGIAETSGARFRKKDFQKVTVKYADGYFTAMRVNDNCYMFALTGGEVKLGVLYMNMEEAARQLAGVI